MNWVLSHVAIVKFGRAAISCSAVRFGLLCQADLLLNDRKIGKAKSGAAGMVCLKGGDRLLGPSGQAIGVSERAPDTPEDSAG